LIDKFRSQFDQGYDAMREETLARQKAMGIVPENTELPPLNPLGTPETRSGPDGQPFPALDVTRPWDSLSHEEQRLFARMAEVYAGFLAHADHQIGRLLGYLEETGQRENTMVVVVSDNGASGEGGPEGSVNEMKFMNGIPDDITANLAMLDELGGPETYNHYPNGWAMAFNTPFKMWKRYEFNGGTSDPCVISWPAGMKARGEIRDQYHHAIDVTPTILDVLGVTPPDTIRGHTQSRFDGVSMRYSFDEPEAPGAPTSRESRRCPSHPHTRPGPAEHQHRRITARPPVRARGDLRIGKPHRGLGDTRQLLRSAVPSLPARLTRPTTPGMSLTRQRAFTRVARDPCRKD
jgi:arylsulfatase A-like enzyme